MDYAAVVKSCAKDPWEILEKITPAKLNLMHAGIGVSGEAGELLDAIKKYVVYNKPLDTINIIEELGDLEYYMELLRQALNIDREATLHANVDKLSIRYPGLTYSDQAAQQRADKEPS